MKHLFIITLCILVSTSGFAQKKVLVKSDSLTFTGQIFDRETLHVLANAVYVHNQTMYVSDDKGRFRFAANEGDTILFHHIGFKDLILVVEDSLSNEEFLTGIFLSPDMVQLSEVLVIPRQYDLETLVKTTPMNYSQIQIAEKNMRMSAYQALMPNTKWDAETNQKYALQKEAMRIEYKGMISPGQTFGANLITVIPEAALTYGPHKVPQIDLGSITTQEERYLTTVFDAIKKEKEKNAPNQPFNKPPLKPINK